jgi:nitrate/nitrite-specific signal transduction histidine kinase
MEELNEKQDLPEIKDELERTKVELDILYEISNAMRTTLKLDEILYIILTGVTAHTGLGFNRAILFLVNDKDNLIEGKMAIGPENTEEANSIWRQIEQNKMDLDDLINDTTLKDTPKRTSRSRKLADPRSTRGDASTPYKRNYTEL